MTPPPMPVPAHSCPECGEFMPHYCAAVVTIRRERFTGRRVITITDRGRGNA